jgi:hypothetical protein
MYKEEKQYANKSEVTMEVMRIEKRRMDGISMYQKTQAILRLNRLSANPPINHTTYSENVYVPMSNVINQINGGNFLDAHVELFKIQANDYLTEGMLLWFKNEVGIYILTDGDYIDFVGKTIDPLTGIIS